MQVLVGYSMRSGSTLLAHILDQHSLVKSYSDVSSLTMLGQLALGIPARGNICVKPMDVFFLRRPCSIYRFFDKFVWIARDPRDTYLSAVEFTVARVLRRVGTTEHGIHIAQLRRWKRVYRLFMEDRERWHLVKYEELVSNPEPVLRSLLAYLELPYEQLYPFKKFDWRKGGDTKLANTNSIVTSSKARHLREFSPEQQEVFCKYLAEEMSALGYEWPPSQAA